ncbi:MAG: HlyD family efflux transporter periplasmic adaptor subunit [Thermoanaerobaculia bacterium]
MRTATLILIVLVLLTGCKKKDEPDAYGNVEAVDVMVGAESSGRLEGFNVREGQHIPAGTVVASIETTQLHAQRQEASATRAATFSRIAELEKQVGALAVQRDIARRNYERTRRLHAQRAATAQQLDLAERDFKVPGEQIEALRAQQQSIADQVKAAEARIAQVDERIGKGKVVNPIDGTVLAKYAEAGEVTQPGQPLYRIADLRKVEVRAYVVETQLASVKVGQQARVSVDTGKDQRAVVNGTVTWVSSDAEFTPTPIQTREERADLVYAIKISVPNPNGILKIGMPADVDFPAATASK